MSKRRKVDAPPLRQCPNPHCPCEYEGEHLAMHLAGMQSCQAYMMAHSHRTAPHPPTEHDHSPWSDDGDAPASEDEASIAAADDDSATSVVQSLVASRNTRTNTTSAYTVDHYYETQLLKLLNDGRAHHGLYAEILTWAEKAKVAQYSFEPQRKTRRAQVKYLENWQALQHARATQIPVVLPGDPPLTVHVTAYDFVEQLFSLLNDQTFFGTLANLDVNPDDPFTPYESPGGLLNCVNAGAWYRKAYQNCCTQPGDFLVPIIFTFDESVLANQKAQIAPLKFTTSLLNQASRNKDSAWRTLHFVYDIDCMQSKAEARKQGPPLKSQRLHTVFEAGMRSYLAAQTNDQLHNIGFTLGPHTKTVNLKVPCCLIIGDIQGGDKICCSSATYRNVGPRLCRKCNVPGTEAGNLKFKCKRISMEKVHRLVLAEEVTILKSFNQYCVDSPWYYVNYGGDKYGIFSAAMPIEPLHAVETGMMMYSIRVLNREKLKSTNNKIALDALARYLTTLPRQRLMSAGSEPSMPRLLWKDGITSLSQVTASHKVGMVLTVVVLSLTKAGTRLFHEVMGPITTGHMRSIFQQLLAYRQWLKRKTYWKRGDKDAKEKARKAILKMLKALMKKWPREKGQGWAIAKVHEQRHVPDDIERHGPPSGSHTGVTEHQHIALKKDTMRTQRNRETLDQQAGNRLTETTIINECYERMERMRASAAPPVDVPVRATDYIPPCTMGCFVADPDGTVDYTEPTSSLPLLPEVRELLIAEMARGKFPSRTVSILSEVVTKHSLYRAHGAYKTQPQGWHDWVMLRFTKDNPDFSYHVKGCCPGHTDSVEQQADHHYAPGKILAFVTDAPPVRDAAGRYRYDHAKVKAIVATCKFRYEKSSLFSSSWKPAPHYHGRHKTGLLELVDVSAFVRHCLMIPFDKSGTLYHEIWPPELWADTFHK